MTLIYGKKFSADVQLIHAEQISLYNFIVLRKNNRHSLFGTCNIQLLFASNDLIISNIKQKGMEYIDVCHCFNDISVNANLISVRLKSKRQRINTINFYLRDISTPLVGVVFKHRD